MWKKRYEPFLLLLPQPRLWCQVCGWWMWFAIFNRWAASQRQVVKCLDHQILSVSCITPAHPPCSFHLSVPETSLCSTRLGKNVQTVVSCHFCPLNFEEAAEVSPHPKCWWSWDQSNHLLSMKLHLFLARAKAGCGVSCGCNQPEAGTHPGARTQDCDATTRAC